MDWTKIALLVAAVILLPYVLGPLLIKATLRFFGEPRIEMLAGRPVPDSAVRLWAGADPAMAALGFEAGPPMRVQLLPGIWTLCKVYARPADKDLAMAAAMYRSHKGRTVLTSRHLEFSSDFGSDGSVTTNNSREVGFEAPSQDRAIVRAPQVQDPRELYALHREACRRFGYGPKQPVPAGEWWIASVRQSTDKFARRMSAAGYLRSTRAGDYVLTWRGALVGTYQNLFPWKHIKRSKMNAAVTELKRAGRV